MTDHLSRAFKAGNEAVAQLSITSHFEVDDVERAFGKAFVEALLDGMYQAQWCDREWPMINIGYEMALSEVRERAGLSKDAKS